MALFKIHIRGLICAQHDCISPFIMVYGCLLSIQHNDQEMQGSVNSVSLCAVSLQKASQNDHSYLCFVLNFLLPGKHDLQIGNVTSTDGICRQCWEDRGLRAPVF